MKNLELIIDTIVAYRNNPTKSGQTVHESMYQLCKSVEGAKVELEEIEDDQLLWNCMDSAGVHKTTAWDEGCQMYHEALDGK